MTSQNRVSLKDIARKAGVSVTLVSYVLNDKHTDRIKKETADRIKKVAEKLNYKPNIAARSLKTRSTKTIGLIVGDISNSFFSSLAKVIEESAERIGYTVIYGSSNEHQHRFSLLVDTFLNRQVDGLILAPPEDCEEKIMEIRQSGIPFVLVDRYFPSIPTDQVILNNAAAASVAVNHLLSNGRKRIGLITYKSDLNHLIDREKGYRSALSAAGLKIPARIIRRVSEGQLPEETVKAVDELLHMKPAVDAILFTTNLIAEYAVKHINSLPQRVPKDIALLSFDEIHALDLFYAPLTYLRQPVARMGEKAVQILEERINGRKAIYCEELEAELVIRAST